MPSNLIKSVISRRIRFLPAVEMTGGKVEMTGGNGRMIGETVFVIPNPVLSSSASLRVNSGEGAVRNLVGFRMTRGTV